MKTQCKRPLKERASDSALNKNILYVFTSRRNVHVSIRSIFNVAPELVTSEFLQPTKLRGRHLKKYQLVLTGTDLSAYVGGRTTVRRRLREARMMREKGENG